MQTHVKINRKVAFFIEYSGTKKSKSCCHPPFHPPNFCRHSLKLLSPTLPQLMNWILLSPPPLSSDPDNPQNLERAPEEYQQDDFASGSEDEKRLFRSERHAERKIKQRRRTISRARYQKSSSIQYSNFEEKDLAQKILDGLQKLAPEKGSKPTRKIGPCFKISIFSRTSFVYLSVDF